MLNELFHEITPITLNHEDLNCMKHSIENRSPFLDKEIIHYTQKLDNSILLMEVDKKYYCEKPSKIIYILMFTILNKKLASMLLCIIF